MLRLKKIFKVFGQALLTHVRSEALQAYEHAEVPFECVLEALRHPEGSAACRVAFISEHRPLASYQLSSELSCQLLPNKDDSSKLDLTLLAVQRPEGLCLVAHYNDDLFSGHDIQRLLIHYQILLRSALDAPNLACTRLRWLHDQEIAQWQGWSTGPQASPPSHLTTLLTAQADKTPERIALRYRQQSLSYQMLEQQSNQLAHQLHACGIARADRVGLCLPRGFDWILSMLAVFKLGATCLPLDETYPPERLRFMLQDAQVRTVLTHRHLLQYLENLKQLPSSEKSAPSIDYQVLDSAAFIRQQSRQARSAPEARGDPGDIANVIYTSGSTGQPKGVLVRHRGLANMALAQIDLFEVTADSHVLQFASPSFDASMSEILMALLCGATLHLADRDDLVPGAALHRLLLTQSISTVTLPPSALSVLPDAPLPALKTLIVAGESCPPQLIEKWSAGRAFYNAYGPTENSVCATVARHGPHTAQASIGKPIAGVNVYLLDDHLQALPAGIAGEIYLGGAGLASGYLHRPSLTDALFIDNPFDQQNLGDKLYRTGDLASHAQDGQLIFHGRRDHQLKIRGFRIEPEEIQHCLCQHPEVTEALVIASDQLIAHDTLSAFVISDSSDPAGLERQLRKQLRQRLPAYMVPSHFHVLRAFTLTSNGKIDRKALPGIPARRTPEAARPGHCRDPLEWSLLRLWQTVLPGIGIAPQDSFFDIGGHSLLAVKLAALIQQEFGREISLSSIVQHPTIEALAEEIRRENPRPWSPLVPLSQTTTATGGQPALFLVHPLGGNIMGYLPLLKHLPDSMPVYALQAPGVDPRHPPIVGMETLGAHYLAAIRKAQPCGPYRLGGHSFGGTVAFEIAQQLRQAGEEVEFLVMLDSPAPIGKNRPRSVENDAQWLLRRCQVIAQFSGIDLALDAEKFVALPADQQIKQFLQVMHAADLLPPKAGEPMVQRLLAVQKASHNAISHYQPKPYDGQLHLIRAQHPLNTNQRPEMIENFQDPLLDWQHLCPLDNIHLAHSTGDHISMLTEPHVKDCAHQIRRWLG